jgi:hypothetical protein
MGTMRVASAFRALPELVQGLAKHSALHAPPVAIAQGKQSASASSVAQHSTKIGQGSRAANNARCAM